MICSKLAQITMQVPSGVTLSILGILLVCLLFPGLGTWSWTQLFVFVLSRIGNGYSVPPHLMIISEQLFMNTGVYHPPRAFESQRNTPQSPSKPTTVAFTWNPLYPNQGLPPKLTMASIFPSPSQASRKRQYNGPILTSVDHLSFCSFSYPCSWSWHLKVWPMYPFEIKE